MGVFESYNTHGGVFFLQCSIVQKRKNVSECIKWIVRFDTSVVPITQLIFEDLLINFSNPL